MTPAWNMTPAGIQKELARRREQLAEALKYGRSKRAEQHRARIEELERVAGSKRPPGPG